MLGTVPEKVVGRLGDILGGVERAYEDQRIAVGGRGLELGDIVKMLQTTSSEKRTLVCVDTLNAHEAEHRAKPLD